MVAKGRIIMKIGGFIRKERMKKGLSMRELSRQSGVTLSYLSNLENDKLEHSPNIEIVLDLLKALKVSEPFQKLIEFGLVEAEVSIEEKYNKTKRNRYVKEVGLLLEGMELNELEGLFFLLKDHFSTIELLSSIDHRKDVLDQFETYVEFSHYKQAKKEGKPIELNPNAQDDYQTFSTYQKNEE